MKRRNMLRWRQIRVLLAIAPIVTLCPAPARADEPLHARIDQMLEQAHVGQPAPLCTDAEFVRRVYLDLTGSIPPVDEARAFLADESPDKRARLVDKLLASPAYVRHMSGVFDVMLMERRPDKHVKSPEWQKYLLESFQANKPYDQLAREILSADGVDDALRPAAKFYLDREAEPNLLTRDVGRLFFGMDLQCAQCHDHPLIDDYYQSDYYGIYAFFNRTSLFTIKDKKQVVLQEKADGEVTFKSVFTGEDGDSNPRLPGGAPIGDPAFPKGEEYQVKPAKDVRPIPKYSRREQLAKYAASGENRAFNRNIANRLWGVMMGQGLVDPPDLHHTGNPPAHPALVEMLGDEFVAMKFDIKAMLRQLALSRAYQRSIEPPAELASQAAVAKAALPAIEKEQSQIAESVDQAAAALKQAAEVLAGAEKEAPPLAEALAKASETSAAAKKAADEAAAALAEASKQLAAKQDVAGAVKQAADKAAEAAKILPDEKDVAAAAATFQAKSTQLAAEVAALAKAQQDKSALSQQKAQELAAAIKTAQEAAAKDAAARQKLADALSKRDEAVVRLEREQAAAGHVERRVADAQELIKYGQLFAQAEASRQAADKLIGELTAGKAKTGQIAAALPPKQSELAAAESANKTAAETLEAAKAQFAEKQKAAALVAEVSAKSEVAREKLPDDKELAQSADNLKTRSEQLTAEAAAAQKAMDDATAAAQAAATALAAARKTVDDMTAEMNQLVKRLPELEQQAPAAQEKATLDRVAVDEAFAALSEDWTQRFAMSSLEPLTPEQLGWSMLTATGMVERQRAAEAAELNKKTPLSEEAQKDPAQVAARAAQVEQQAYDKLKGNVNIFVSLFGAGAGQPQQGFFATVDQALFMANGGQVRGWLNPSGGNLTDRLNKTEDSKQLAEELYMSVLTRTPTAEESAHVAQYLASREKERSAAVQEMAWALLTSSEFRFGH